MKATTIYNAFVKADIKSRTAQGSLALRRFRQRKKFLVQLKLLCNAYDMAVYQLQDGKRQ